MKIRAIGLIVFSIVIGLNAAGLGLDAALFQQGFPTITDIARRNPWLTTIIILVNALGLVGLVVHLSNGQLDD